MILGLEKGGGGGGGGGGVENLNWNQLLRHPTVFCF